jgi:prepilin-type N-terminal cleavage/methylation domain-containing protein
MLSNDRGFSLIELIITIIVISVGVLGLIAAMSFTTGRSINAELMTTTTLLAQERMEELIGDRRSSGYGTASLDIGTTTDPAFGAPYADYTRTVEICYVDSAIQNPDCDPAPPNVDTGYKRMTITVENNMMQAASNVSIVSLVTDY